MKVIAGEYITIEEYNIYFASVTDMLLEHFDTPEYKDTVIILGSYIKYPATMFKSKYPNKKIIVYQLEQMIKVPGDTWCNTQRTIQNLIGADEIWDYDELNIKFLEEYHNIVVDRLIPLRYVKSLDRNMKVGNEDIDLLFYGQLYGRRLRIIQKLEQCIYGKVNLVCLFGITGEELDKYIERSKIVLNIHAFEPYHRQEQQRIFYLLINGKCVLSEESQLNHFGEMITEFKESNMVGKINYILENDRYRKFGLDAREKFKRNER